MLKLIHVVGGYITLHSLDSHVREVNEKVHLMSDFSKVITAKMNTLTVKRSLYLMLSHSSALVCSVALPSPDKYEK